MTRTVKEVSAHHTAPEPADADIRIRSYQIWQAEGCPDGKAQDHWLRARKELVGQSADKNTTPGPAEKKAVKKTVAASRSGTASRTAKTKVQRHGSPAHG